MADAKISALTALTGANVASNDLLPIVDTSATTTKSITRREFSTYNDGTVTTSTPLMDYSQTWNSGAVTFTGLKLNVTNTASAAASMLIDLQVGGSSKFNVNSVGTTKFTGGDTAISTSSSSTRYIGQIAYDGSNLKALATSPSYIQLASQTLNLYPGSGGVSAGDTVTPGTAALAVTNSTGVTSNVSHYFASTAQFESAQALKWSQNSIYNTADTGLSRVSAGVIGVGTGTAGSTAGTLQALKYTGIGGTVTASAPVLDITQTWNSGGTTFTAIKADITNTASAVGSKLLDLQLGGANVLSVTRAGLLTLGNPGTSQASIIPGAFNGEISFGSGSSVAGQTLYVDSNDNEITVKSTSRINWSSTTDPSASTDTALSRKAAGIVSFDTTAAGNGLASLHLAERTAPSAPAANGVYIYAEDNGSGKTRLMAIFGSGAAQQIAIEP